MQFNGDTAGNYSTHFLFGDSNAANPYSAAGVSSDYMALYYTNAANSATNAFGAGVVDILDPFETTKNKTIRTLGGQTGYSMVTLTSGSWRNTSALSSLNIFSEGGHSFATNSRFSLYGIKATA
jgi:ABC-type transport system substrate-binding protein